MAKKRKKKRLYGTGDRFDNVPFNIDNLPRDKRVRKIFADYGYTSWRDIFVDLSDLQKLGLEGVRGTLYPTPNELIRAYAKERAILHSVRMAYDHGTGMYYAYVGGSDFAFPNASDDDEDNDEE